MGKEDGRAKGMEGGPDGWAIQRTFLVLAGLCVVVIAYFGVKFAW